MPDPPTTSRGHSMSHMRAPVYEALIAYQQQHIVPLHTPGHKGIIWPDGLEQFLTPLGLACDLPSMDETDNGFHPKGCLAEAQHLTADLYGAADTFYLVNGSTVGVQAMILATVNPGEKILLSRNFHLSTFSALVLSGAVPVYLPSRWLEAAGPIPPTIDEIKQCLQDHPDTRAIFLVHPSYYGIGNSLAPLAAFCRDQHIALLVDEAHGAHLRFLPPGYLSSALDDGADVVVQSVHKTLCSLVGTAQMHRPYGSSVSRERLQWALNLLQSTSSNYLLLASLDLTRRWAWQSGNQAFENATKWSNNLRARLISLPRIKPLDIAHFPELAGCNYDPLRLVVDVSDLGMSGLQLERRLQEEFHLGTECSDHRNVIFVLGPADHPQVYAQLERAFRRVAMACSGRARGADNKSINTLIAPPVIFSPREAACYQSIQVPLSTAIGRVCSEVITMYPPGIPLICPGEQVTSEIASYCEQLSAQTAFVFANDASLATIGVIDCQF